MGARVMALQEQAEALGHSTIQEALDAGYEVSYRASRDHKLYKPDEQEKAHEAWLKEREEVLDGLISVYSDVDVPRDLKKYIEHAIEFVKKGEC